MWSYHSREEVLVVVVGGLLIVSSEIQESVGNLNCLGACQSLYHLCHYDICQFSVLFHMNAPSLKLSNHLTLYSLKGNAITRGPRQSRPLLGMAGTND